MTTPTDTASTARRQVDLDTLGTVAEQVGEFELAIARMANDPAMDVGQAPELLGRAGNRLADVREIPRKARRDVIEGVRGNSRSGSNFYLREGKDGPQRSPPARVGRAQHGVGYHGVRATCTRADQRSPAPPVAPDEGPCFDALATGTLTIGPRRARLS